MAFSLSILNWSIQSLKDIAISIHLGQFNAQFIIEHIVGVVVLQVELEWLQEYMLSRDDVMDLFQHPSFLFHSEQMI